MSRIKFAVALGLATFAIAVPGASAATTVGQTFAPVGTFPSSNRLAFQSLASGEPSHAVPSAGVITSFGHTAAASPTATLSLVVLRPVGPDYFVVSVGEPKSLAGSVLNTFTARTSVNSGDFIGILGSDTTLAFFKGPLPGNAMMLSPTVPTAGATLSAGSFTSLPMAVVDLSANVEADADADGFGDETQDLCPTDNTTQGACDTAGPKLTLTATTTQKTKSSFSFSAVSDEASSTTVDGKLTYYVRKNGKKQKKTIKLAPVTQSLSAGVSSKFSVTLSSKAKSALKKAGKLKAALSIVSTDAKGNKSTNTLSLTIKRK